VTHPRIEDILPLAPLQDGLYFEWLYTGDGHDPYVLQQSLDLTGPLDADRLRHAAHAVLACHPNLRSGFRARAKTGGLMQVVLRETELPWELVDLSAMEDPTRDAEMSKLLSAQRNRGFDLARPPLLRFVLVRTGQDRHHLVMTYHHIVLDGWSVGVLLRQIIEMYDSGARPRAGSYREYLTWLAERDRASAEAAWASYLTGIDAATSISPASRADGFSPRRATRLLDRGLTARLQETARANDLTMNTVVQAAWALTVSRFCGSGDVMFGKTVAGRPAEVSDMDQLVGMFANTLPVRVRLTPHETLAELCTRIQSEQARMARHEHLGLADIQQLCGLREMFDTSVVFQNFPDDIGESLTTRDGLRAATGRGQNVMPYPLALSAFQRDGQLVARFDFADEMFDASTIDALSAEFLRTLAQMATEPATPVAHAVPPPAEGVASPVAGEDHADSRPSMLLDLFQQQVVRTPHAAAVVCDDTELSYARLNAQANQLARLLISRGVGPECTVALVLPRSIDLVLAVLAVLKAGGAYLPIEPDYPADRIGFVLRDAEPALAVTVGEAAASLPAGTENLLLDHPGTNQALADLPETDIAAAERVRPLHPDHPAYVIYTSGSTGLPKGVVVPNRNIVRLFGATRQGFDFGTEDVWPLFHSHAIDVSVWEIWGALLNGGRLVIVPRAAMHSPADLWRLFERERVTVLNQTPSAFYELVRAAEEDRALVEKSCLRYVVLAREKLDFSRVSGCYDLWRDTPPLLVNMYGLTETTVHVIYSALNRDLDAAESSSIIGSGIRDSQLYLLDSMLRPAPQGATAELYIAGPGLARGYVDRPVRTAQRFVANPFGPPGARMYRSGDLARRRVDGNLEFVGRADDQIKIRGFRTELGEVEAALARHPSVAQCAVVAHEHRRGDHRLAAYVLPADGVRPGAAALCEHLAALLPDYLVPSAFTLVDALPLTSNGNVDRRALPAPDFGAATSGRAPRTALEQTVCGLFAEVLGVEAVGIDDNFFELGGYSLLATRLIARIRSSLGIELTVRQLFEAQTVSWLIGELEMTRKTQRPALRRVPRGKEI
jgi:amino acid adenylation domain-containing protein